jgi:signal transduction histidine kinase
VREWIEAERVRERLAHQLHDGPIQELTAAQLFLDGLAMRMESEDVAPDLREGLQRGLDALRLATLACRDLMDRLRPGIGAEGELEERLSRLVRERARDAAVEVALPRGLAASGVTPALLVFRVAEELLEHVRRAGATARALRLEQAEAGALVLSLALDRTAPPPPVLPESWRLAGIVVAGDGAVWSAVVPGAGREAVPD